MSSSKSFAVVSFLSDNSMTAIPTTWAFTGKPHEKGDHYCYWPTKDVVAKIKKCEPPNKEKWTVLQIRVFSYADSYESAMRKCSVGIDTSTIETDSESSEVEFIGKRKSKKNKRYLDTDTSQSDDGTMGKRIRTIVLPDAPLMQETSSGRSKQTFSRPFSSFGQRLDGLNPVATVTSPQIDSRNSTCISPITGATCSYSSSPVPSVRGIVRSSMSPYSSGGSPFYDQVLQQSSYHHQAEPTGTVILPQLATPRGRRNNFITEDDHHQSEPTGTVILPQLATPRGRRNDSITQDEADKLLSDIADLRRSQLVLKENQDQIINLLRNLVAGKNNNDVVLEDLISKPCETQEHLDDLESSIKNQDFRKKIVLLLVTLAGNKLSDSMRKMLRALGTNNLWSSYSLKGKRNKKPFVNLSLCRVIIKACLKVHKGAKVNEVQEHISETLKHAPAQKDGPKYKQRPVQDGQQPEVLVAQQRPAEDDESESDSD